MSSSANNSNGDTEENRPCLRGESASSRKSLRRAIANQPPAMGPTTNITTHTQVDGTHPSASDNNPEEISLFVKDLLDQMVRAM